MTTGSAYTSRRVNPAPNDSPGPLVLGSAEQIEARKQLVELFGQSPLPSEQLLTNLGLYMRSSVLAKVLYVNELYELILDVPGAIIECGVWWGQNLALFESLRAIYEPYNHTRKVVGFDTFAGYRALSPADGDSDYVREGAYDVGVAYEDYLRRLLDYHERENPLSHLRKYELVAGDATETVGRYFSENPETVVALAYLDAQLYRPTKACLEAILPHTVNGSVIALDELGSAAFPGETQAARELLDLRACRIRRSKYLPDRTYVILD